MTGEQIKGEECDSIEVALVDVLSGQVVTSGPLASAKVGMVVLKGDFDADGQDWTVEEFNKNIVIDMEGKINGTTCLNLKEGLGVLDEISFKHSSGWTKKCELRLGARVVDNPSGIRVREAKTEPFILKDRRNNLYDKHCTPSLRDEVWRLDNIGKDGAYHKRLSKEKVDTVKGFLELLFLDPARLRNILGKSISGKRWEVTVYHAQTCKLNGKLYFYCPPGSQEKTGVVFSVVGQLMGLLSECHYVPVDLLSETDKADAHNLVKSAFEYQEDVSAFKHREDVVSFDDDAFLMDGYSGLSNVLYPSISSKIANSDGDKILTCHKKTRFDDPQPSGSSPDIIIPSIYSVEGILGKSMSDKRWEVTVDHAQECILDRKLYFYCPPWSQEKTGVVFSVVGQLKGLLSECRYVLIDKLSETDKADAHNLVTSAFEHWDNVVSFDDDANLMDGYSGLFNVLYPSISSKRASSDEDNILTCQKKTRFNDPQPSVSSLDILPSIYSVGGLDDFDFINCNIGSMCPDFFDDEKWQQGFGGLIARQSQNLSWDSQANIDSAVNGFPLACSTPTDKVRRRWTMLSSVLKWFYMRRIVARRTQVEQV